MQLTSLLTSFVIDLDGQPFPVLLFLSHSIRSFSSLLMFSLEFPLFSRQKTHNSYTLYTTYHLPPPFFWELLSLESPSSQLFPSVCLNGYFSKLDSDHSLVACWSCCSLLQWRVQGMYCVHASLFKKSGKSFCFGGLWERSLLFIILMKLKKLLILFSFNICFQLLDECSSDQDCEAGLYCFSCPQGFSGSRCVRSTISDQFKLLVAPLSLYTHIDVINPRLDQK